MVSTALTQAVEATPAETDQPKGPVALLQSPAMLQQVTESLPAEMDATSFVRHGVTLVKQNPKLLACDPVSVAQGIVRGAALGLDPDPALGQMWLVPRRVKKSLPGGGEQWVDEATFQVGYRGYLELIQRTGRFAKVEVHEVREHDHFDARFGSDGRLVHRPDWFADRGPVVGWYAYAQQKDGTESFEILGRAEAETHRDRFAPKNRKGEVYGPWVEHFDSMAAKTVLLKLAKWLPKSVEQQHALAVDGTVTRTPLGSEVREVDVIRVDAEPAAIPAAVTEPEVVDEQPVEADGQEAGEVEVELPDEQYVRQQQRKLNARLNKLFEKPDVDRKRHGLASLVSNGRTESSNELTVSEWQDVVDALDALEAGDVELFLKSDKTWELRRIVGGGS